MLAIFLVATGSRGLQLVAVPIWVSSLFNGTVLVIAVALAHMRAPGGARIERVHGIPKEDWR